MDEPADVAGRSLGLSSTVSAIAPIPDADQRGSILVGVLERAWSDIPARHPKLPPIVIITGAGFVARRAPRAATGPLRCGALDRR